MMAGVEWSGGATGGVERSEGRLDNDFLGYNPGKLLKKEAMAHLFLV
jgi:hypothetical protein